MQVILKKCRQDLEAEEVSDILQAGRCLTIPDNHILEMSQQVNRRDCLVSLMSTGVLHGAQICQVKLS